MAEPFLAEIKMFGGNFPPRGYAFCDGQVQSIAQNTALFSLVGTFYGGNGQTTFALPDLRDRTPMSSGNGPGLTPRVVGESDGSSTVSLIATEMPLHTHSLAASSSSGSSDNPSGASFGTIGRGRAPIYSSTAPSVQMSPTGIGGGGQPHNNRQPYLGLYFIIALQGVFPPRN
jgi:microcystin-dependent protein